MKKVAILALETAVPAAIVDPRYMFSAVNMFFAQAGHQPFFEVMVVGQHAAVQLDGGLVTISPDHILANAPRPDLILVPAISGPVGEALAKNEAFLPWIVEQYRQGTEVASLCIGAFVLAATGLLSGKTCSTHWLFANEFRDRYPEVHLAADRIISEQDGLYSSGGAHAYWNLLLYLVEKYTSREMAIMASKFFVLDPEQTSQLPFSIFKGQKAHGDEVVLAAQDWLERHYEDKVTVARLADQLAVGRRTLERRFKKATTNSVLEYAQRVKVEVAKRHLELRRATVNEVMYTVGYSDTKAFREVFRKYAGVSPQEYQSRFA